MIGDLQMAPKGTSDRIDEIGRLVEAELLRAASVGFRPIERKPRMVEDRACWRDFRQADAHGERQSSPIPANPNSLAIMKSLEISDETRKLVFVEHDNKDKPKRRD